MILRPSLEKGANLFCLAIKYFVVIFLLDIFVF